MRAYSVVLFLVVAAIRSASCSDWTYVASENGKVELINKNYIPMNSRSTSSELKEDVIFNLFTPYNTEESSIIYVDDDDALSASYFDASRPTRIIIHGWQNSASSPVNTVLTNAYLSSGDYNVIVLDWNSYAKRDYVTARSKVTTVGGYAATLIDYLETQGMNINDLIVIGHSLGAHIAGVTSRNAKNVVPALIGLDPAGPLFNTADEARLSSDDAAYVQVIHTNSALLGHKEELGDADFWPNGGEWQAGCKVDVTGSCSHGRSYEYLAESITTTGNKFIAYKCDSYELYSSSKCTDNESTYMGGAILDTSASGNYALDTNSDSPYAMN